jgi:hypothetical protein
MHGDPGNVKLKLDENLPVELVTDLRVMGHDADTVTDEGLRGAADPDAVDAAFTAGRILFTLDKGIANLRRYPIANMRERPCFDLTPREEGPSPRLCASGYMKCSKWTSPAG